MSKYTPVEEVIRAWVIRGSHPGYHEFQKSLLRENWPTLYNAIERLVLEHGENKMSEHAHVEEGNIMTFPNYKQVRMAYKLAQPSASTGKTVSQDERADEIDRWLVASAEAAKRYERERIIGIIESIRSGDEMVGKEYLIDLIRGTVE